MSDDLVLVDTNILVYGHSKDSDRHAASQTLLNSAQDGELVLCATPQIIAEFHRVIMPPAALSDRRIQQPPADAL